MVPPRIGTRSAAFNAWAEDTSKAVQRLRDRHQYEPPKEIRRAPQRIDQLALIRAEYNTNATSVDCYVEPGSLQVVAMGSRTVDFAPFLWAGNTHYSNTKIPISNGNSLYAHYEVDDEGTVNASSVELRVEISDYGTQPHWRPRDPEGNGSVGNAMIELFRVEVNNSTVTTERITDDNPVHYIDAWVGTNLGNGGEHYKQKLVGNEYEFRTTNGNYAVTETQTSDEVLLDFVGNNIGTGEIVYLPQDDANKNESRVAEFKGFIAGAGLTVSTVGNDIKYEATGGVNGNNCNLHVRNVNYSKQTVDGFNNVVQWVSDDAYDVYYWRDGAYKGTVDPGLTGACDDIYTDHWVVGS